MQSAKKDGLSCDTVLKGEILPNILLWDGIVWVQDFLRRKPRFQDNVVSEKGTFFNNKKVQKELLITFSVKMVYKMVY